MNAKLLAAAFLIVVVPALADDQKQPMTNDQGAAEDMSWLFCPIDPREPNASYVGPYKGFDNNLTGADLARDAYCADLFKSTRYPNGYVTVFGSSSITETFEIKNPNVCAMKGVEPNAPLDRKAIEDKFRDVYVGVQTFANEWTAKYGNQYPILSGAGPGLMEAASRGASDAGRSIGYTTYYSPPKPGDPHGASDDPRFWRYTHPKTKIESEITTDGLVFSSVSARETAMILHSAAIVIAPGGTGTEWETFQILEMLKSSQLKRVPVYFIGDKCHWKTLSDRVDDMVARGTVKPGKVSLEFAECSRDLLNRVSKGLRLTDVDPPPASEVCAKPSEYQLRALKEFSLH